MLSYLIGGAVGFVVAAFAPAVGREIKSWFVKESTAAVAAVPAQVKTAVVAAANEVAKKA